MAKKDNDGADTPKETPKLTLPQARKAAAEKLWSEAKKAVYVENGVEYPATVVPLPVVPGKGEVIDVPQLADPASELQRIMSLPVQQQVKEIAEYQRKLGTPAKALLNNGTIKRLEMHEGVLCQTTEKEGRFIPAPDLLIDFGENVGVIYKQRVLPEAYVPRAAKGTRQKSFFRFVSMLLLSLLSLSAFAADSGGVSEGLQRWAGRKIFIDRVPVSTTLAGNVTLDKNSTQVRFYDCDGSHRDVTLPAVASSIGYEFIIRNTTAATYNLVVKNAGGSTIATVGALETGYFYCDGITWVGYVLSESAAGYLAASGATAGAVSQAQDFGATYGIKTDIIAESTAAAGVTIDSVLLKDNVVRATGVDAGASGTAGTVDVFPTTASKGKIAIAATDNTNNDTTTITNAAQGGAYTYTIPDAGGAAEFVMNAGTQTIAGAKTFSSSLAGDGQPRYIEVALTNAEMLDLADTPKTLIAAPGAGKMIMIESIVFLFDYTAVYTVTAGDDLCVNYENEAGITIATGEATGFVDQTADVALLVNPATNVVPTKTVSENKAVILCNEGSDFGGGNAANAVRVKIAYRTWATGF